MSEIIPLLICLQPILTKTSLCQLRHVVFALLCKPTQATMLGLSRWTEKVGSYRTIQRLYRTPMDLSQALLKPYHLHDPHFSVRDLKAQFRARCYLMETIKMLPETPEPDLISRIWQRLTRFGGIRTRPLDDFAA